jgi:hypothetical protein
MPQDQLWAASARLTGYRIQYAFGEAHEVDDVLTVETLWSKTPSDGRCKSTVIPVSAPYADAVPAILESVHLQLLNGDARQVGAVARYTLFCVQHGY